MKIKLVCVMAAEMGSFAGLNFPTFNKPTNKLFSRPPLQPAQYTNKRRRLQQQFTISANLGGGGGGEGELKKEDKKKFITKEQEPEQYWQTAGEREGENPMSTPLPYIIIFGMSTPFIILAIAFANGWIKAPIR
ncbi:PREDICTED: uncharacterized protein LOC105951291 [Erythranthe guttata]|nr:PREDICTED: uncharacterized protein LOC105951291 [Erythranthe guttata]|eukprot:XP_012830152.1 PREDICTED: uncharacterized protein LOC105951291 [Erythranthe guttata]